MNYFFTRLKSLSFLLVLMLSDIIVDAQFRNTEIRGFVDVVSSYQNEKVSFSLGEQDLFITSELSDRLTFLGESVFRFAATSSTSFDVSIERIILKYNIKGNHNILVGKHHTPINYWNDTYHHGRVFFPTVYRPLLFSAGIIPLHTTGISLQGANLGNVKFGYDVMVGNGLGSDDITDNNSSKSITAAVHIKPLTGLRIGASYYKDMIAGDSNLSHHGGSLNKYHQHVHQQILSGSVAYFGNKFEFLGEGSMSINETDSTGVSNNTAFYCYAGYKATEKITPYVRFDYLDFGKKEIYYKPDNTNAFIAGIRYQINYLAVVKLEFEHDQSDVKGTVNKFAAQFAIGF